MECLIISKRSDEFIARLEIQLTALGFDARQTDRLSSSDANPPLPHGSVILVDLRSRENLDNLIKLHFREPYARIIGFADSAHLAFERTALTFGGADAFIPTSDGVKVIAAKAQELAKLSEPKGKYKTPLGLTFTAGTFLLNTKNKISLALPPGHRNLTDALSAYISSAKSIFSSDKPVPLTPAQVLALEFLKQVRDDEIPGREGYYASGREIVAHVYRQKKTRDLSHTFMNPLIRQLSVSSKEEYAHLAGVIHVPERGYRLNVPYEDLNEPEV